MICLLKTSRDLQMLLAAVTRLAEGLSLETLLTLYTGGEVRNLLSGYTETNSVHNRTVFFLKTLIKRQDVFA
jgi:hypothetical protein